MSMSQQNFKNRKGQLLAVYAKKHKLYFQVLHFSNMDQRLFIYYVSLICHCLCSTSQLTILTHFTTFIYSKPIQLFLILI